MRFFKRLKEERGEVKGIFDLLIEAHENGLEMHIDRRFYDPLKERYDDEFQKKYSVFIMDKKDISRLGYCYAKIRYYGHYRKAINCLSHISKKHST